MGPQESKEHPGLSAQIDKLVHYHEPERQPSDAPHAFIYFITIHNQSESTVTLRGRRWVLRHADGHIHVVEGVGIVGKEPTLTPGERYIYNSYHMTHCDCIAQGSFHGIDSSGYRIHLRIPEIEMTIPADDRDHPQIP